MQFVFSGLPLCFLRTTDGWGWHTLKQFRSTVVIRQSSVSFTFQHLISSYHSSHLQKCCQHHRLPLLLYNSTLFATDNDIVRFSFSFSERIIYATRWCLQMDSITQMFFLSNLLVIFFNLHSVCKYSWGKFRWGSVGWIIAHFCSLLWPSTPTNNLHSLHSLSFILVELSLATQISFPHDFCVSYYVKFSISLTRWLTNEHPWSQRMMTHQSRRWARSQLFPTVVALSLGIAPSQQALANHYLNAH